MTIDPTLLTIICGGISAVFLGMSAVIGALWLKVADLEKRLAAIIPDQIAGLAAKEKLKSCPSKTCPFSEAATA